ncbi:MAG TPA: tetratricopeptide repeat protein [Pyrinomonadaceae bacterium]|nr:tetratricopeptide repeat protein [Pyrinomonadaceae bacterium]
MKRILLITVLLVSAHLSIFSQAAISYRQQAWELGNNLSRAALVNAMSDDVALAGRTFASAEANALRLKIRLPKLPAKTNDKIKDQAAALNYLLNVTGAPGVRILGQDFGPAHAALFELAFKINLLLMLPDGKEGKAIVDVINKRYEAAGLTPETFSALTMLVSTGAPFEEIKKEVFSVQKVTPLFVAVNEFTENGEAYYAQKDYARSAAEFSNALGISPEEPKFLYLRARANMQSSKFAEAIADYSKAIQFTQSAQEKRNLPVIYHNRGLCYALTKRYAQALPDLTTAIRLKPEYASAYKIRSMVHTQMGSIKLAAADRQQAETLQPGIMN